MEPLTTHLVLLPPAPTLLAGLQFAEYLNLLSEVYAHAKGILDKIETKEFYIKKFTDLADRFNDSGDDGRLGVVVGGQIQYLPEDVTCTTASWWMSCVESCINELQDDVRRLRAEFEDL